MKYTGVTPVMLEVGSRYILSGGTDLREASLSVVSTQISP